MKTKRYSNKLIQLQILKLHYKERSYAFKTSLKQTEIHLNKISNIVYKYHITDRKILFIGFPNKFAEILSGTRHLVLPEYIWFNGMLSNRTRLSSPSSQTTAKKQAKMPLNLHQLLLKLKKKLDLVIVYNLNDKATAVKESYLSRIPVITLSGNLDILNNNATYKSPKSFNFVNEKITHNNIFYSILKTTLRRAISAKKTKNLKFRNMTSDFFQKKNTNRTKPLKKNKTSKKQKPYRK